MKNKDDEMVEQKLADKKEFSNAIKTAVEQQYFNEVTLPQLVKKHLKTKDVPLFLANTLKERNNLLYKRLDVDILLKRILYSDTLLKHFKEDAFKDSIVYETMQTLRGLSKEEGFTDEQKQMFISLLDSLNGRLISSSSITIIKDFNNMLLEDKLKVIAKLPPRERITIGLALEQRGSKNDGADREYEGYTLKIKDNKCLSEHVLPLIVSPTRKETRLLSKFRLSDSVIMILTKAKFTQKDIADILNIKQSAVSQRLNRKEIKEGMKSIVAMDRGELSTILNEEMLRIKNSSTREEPKE